MAEASNTRTWVHVVAGTVVETLATSIAIADLFPNSMTWVDVTALSPQPVAGWTYAAGNFAPPVAVPEVLPKLTSLEFMALLTSSEQTAIATAAQSNAAVLVWLLKISGATYVDLGDPQTVAGVDAMVTAGLLTSDRAKAILANQAAGS